MKLESAIEKIKRYFSSSTTTPIVVDLQNGCDFEKIQEEFQSSFYSYVAAGTYCKEDNMVLLDNLKEDLIKNNKPVFLTELSTFLKLEGVDYLKNQIRILLDLPIAGHVVILTYQCSKYLDFKDPRLKAAQKIISVDGVADNIPEITFVSPEASLKQVYSCKGLSSLGRAVEYNPQITLYLKTRQKVSLFPKSILKLSELSSGYDILKTYGHDILEIEKGFGTEEQWNYALSNLEQYKNWENLVISLFGGTANLSFSLSEYGNFDNNKKWLYVLSLKLFKNEVQNIYLKSVVSSLTNYTNFIPELFKKILSIKVTDNNFLNLYEERKFLLRFFSKEAETICEYCKFTRSKGKEALYYLTDCSIQEKELIILLLNQYAPELKQDEISDILRLVYPDLYSYLQDYDFKNPLLNGYFQAYKFQKLFNRIAPEFEKIVEKQAVEREYNSILRPRVSYIEKINKQNTLIYFVDALGVEYLSYLMFLCKEKKLFANVTVCRSELPSITCMNKEFIELFKAEGCPVIDIKDLDEIKHKGKNSYDYQLTKEPIHLIEELKILEDLIGMIRVKLANSDYERVVIISDHGASRLAVIHETENKYEMTEKGEHSGRCCPVSDIDEKPPFATEENGYWVLANYDRFKGGRKANVEVHGGASLEEVCIPIIEITQKDASIVVKLLTEYRNIVASYRKTAFIKIYVNKKIDNLKIFVDGKYYEVQSTKDDFIYQVNMPDIRKSKTYRFDVFWANNLIASNLEFTVKSEVTVEKDLF